MPTLFALETSCDETAAAVVTDGGRILSNVVASQTSLHAPYGGVFPEVASRAHVENITGVTEQALREAGCTWTDFDALAVTQGPGLPGSLLVGVNYAQGLALATGLPLLGINHLEGHLYALWAVRPQDPILFPAVGLIVSGGHTELVLMRDHGDYLHLGGTLDDAAGEAFDKVGRLLGLPYPGGPSIQKAAQGGNPQAYAFPRALPDRPYDFSFSGLKTAALRLTQQKDGASLNLADIAASFQAAVVDVLVEKTLKAAATHGAHEILLAGGVSANQALREAFMARSTCPVRIPPLALCTDNAAMIGLAAYHRYQAGERGGQVLDVLPNLALTTRP